MTPSCAHCRFASPEVMGFDADGTAEPMPVLLCFRYPPKMIEIHDLHADPDTDEGIATVVRMRPQVDERDWCGEFQPTPTETPR